MKVDDLFTSNEITAAIRLKEDVELPDDSFSNKETTLVIELDLDFDFSSKKDTEEKFSNYTKYILENVIETIELSRTAELNSIEVTAQGIDNPKLLIKIYEDFRHPVQLIRFISELFENTRNRQYFSRDKNRMMSIYKPDDMEEGLYIQNIDFKDIIINKRHDKHKHRRNFSERESFKAICKLCNYVMLSRIDSIRIYKHAKYQFHGNMDVDSTYAAGCAIQHDEPQDKWFHMSDISEITSTPVMTGFDFLDASINLRNFDYRDWWHQAAFVFYSTYLYQNKYEVYDFDPSGHRTEHAEMLASQCEHFYDFKFPAIGSIFRAGYMWDETLNELYFTMLIKLGPVAHKDVNRGAAYETLFIYKERVKEPDILLTPNHYTKLICDSLKSKYINSHFREEVKLLLTTDLKKILDGFKRR